MKRMFLVIMSLLFFSVAMAQDLPPVNINVADVQQLVTLKGIGPKKAAAIVENRKQSGAFHSVDDLSRIKGMGKAFIQRLLKRNPGRVVLEEGVSK